MSSRASPTAPDRCPSTPCCGRGPRACGVVAMVSPWLRLFSSWSHSWAGSSWRRESSRTAPPPVDRPDPPNLIEIEGIAGDGGLRLEKDLAIGRASVAIVNDTGAFVVTADDGVAHRLALPGFDAPLYARTAAEEGVDFPEMLSLSPDGTKLIYAWHEPFVPPPATCGSRSGAGSQEKAGSRAAPGCWTSPRVPSTPTRPGPDEPRSCRPSSAGSTGTSGGRPTAGWWRSTRD